MFTQLSLVLAGLSMLGVVHVSATPFKGPANSNNTEIMYLLGEGTLAPPEENHPARIKRIERLEITGYSSSPDETDDTPHITASGKCTKRGIIAANHLPFGARVKIPELFGDLEFVVEDRMHRRFSDRIDIWFSSKEEARQFGKKISEVIIEI